jgi:hypothetical protein
MHDVLILDDELQSTSLLIVLSYACDKWWLAAPSKLAKND